MIKIVIQCDCGDSFMKTVEKETKLDELLQDEEITKETLEKMIEKELEKQDKEEK